MLSDKKACKEFSAEDDRDEVDQQEHVRNKVFLSQAQDSDEQGIDNTLVAVGRMTEKWGSMQWVTSYIVEELAIITSSAM